MKLTNSRYALAVVGGLGLSLLLIPLVLFDTMLIGIRSNKHTRTKPRNVLPRPLLQRGRSLRLDHILFLDWRHLFPIISPEKLPMGWTGYWTADGRSHDIRNVR